MKSLLFFLCMSCFAAFPTNCAWTASAQAESIMQCLTTNNQLVLDSPTGYTIEKPIAMQSGWKLVGISPSATTITTSSSFYNGVNKSMLIFNGASGAIVRGINFITTNPADSDGVIQMQSGIVTTPTNSNTVDNVWITSTANTVGGNAVVMVTKDNNPTHSMFFNKFRNMVIKDFRRGFLLFATLPAPWGGAPTPNPVSGNMFDNNTTYAVEHFVFRGGSQQNNIYKHTCAGGVAASGQQICIKLGDIGEANVYTSDNIINATTYTTSVPVYSSLISYKNSVVVTGSSTAAVVSSYENNIELSSGFINKWVGPKSFLSNSHRGGYLIGTITSNGTDYVCLVNGKAMAQEVNSSWANALSRIIQINNCSIGQVYPNNSALINSAIVPSMYF